MKNLLRQIFWIILLPITAGIFFSWQASAQNEPLGKPGTVASYELTGNLDDRPAFETNHRLSVVKATIQLGPVVQKAGKKAFQWYGLEWTRLNGQSYRMWILLDDWPDATRDPEVKQYLWQEPDWPNALRFVHEVTGEAQLPRISLWRYGWPQVPEAGAGSRRAPVKGMPEEILLQGFLFNRTAMKQQMEVNPPEEYTPVELNPDLLNGWVSFDRDADGKPWYRLESEKYEYVEKQPEDLVSYAAAGANFLVSHPGDRAERLFPEWALRSNMYHNNLGVKPKDWPADLYRSNYWGFGNHVDEPGVHNWGLPYKDGPDMPPPEIQVVNNLQKIVKKGIEERGHTRINHEISEDFGLGKLWIEETPGTIVAWEYEWATAWYQLAVEDGVGGMVDEDVINSELVESYNMAFGTCIPPTIENACKIRVAVMRGAARNFNKKWGVAFYHANEVKSKSTSIPFLYNKGAFNFWYWTGWIGITDNSGLPYPYQIYYTSLVRQSFLRNPARNMDSLLRAARVAVVIPYGYTFSPHHMHRVKWLHLERENEQGVTYREVLANAATEVERLIRQGIDFDIAVDDPLFHKKGYDELIYVLPDGNIRIEKRGKTFKRETPRPFSRPDLGPEPQLTLERVEAETGEQGEIRFRAHATLGTGEWSGERDEPRISWEVYQPDGTVFPPVFPVYGPQHTISVDDNARYTMQHPVPEHLMKPDAKKSSTEGSYTIRAATTDIFGRPAVASKTVYLAPGQK